MLPERQFLSNASPCTAFSLQLATQGNFKGINILEIVFNLVFRVDFMSLDIEGSELAVLRTIPFDKVHIELFLIEVFKCNFYIFYIKHFEDPTLQ